MIESITAAGGTDGRTATAGQGKNPNPCVPSQPSLNPCGSPPAYACTHTQGWLGSPRCRGEEESRGEARKGEEDPRQLPGISCLRLCRGRSLPVGTGQRPPRPRARGDVCRCPAEAAHGADAAPAIRLAPSDRWAYSAAGFLTYPI